MTLYISVVTHALMVALSTATVTLGQTSAGVSEVYRLRTKGSATTIVSIRRLQLEHQFGGHCEPLLVAEFAYGKNGPRSAEVVKLGFISHLFEGKLLRVEADPESYELGTLTRLDFVEYSWCRSMPATVGVELERTKFAAIAGSRRIVLHIGERTMPLEREHVQALHALALELESNDDKPVLTRPPN
jgi:hypothetical protein